MASYEAQAQRLEEVSAAVAKLEVRRPHSLPEPCDAPLINTINTPSSADHAIRRVNAVLDSYEPPLNHP